MRKNNEVKAWVYKAEQDFEGDRFGVLTRYPGDETTITDAKRALKAIKEVRKFFALHLPGISETR